MLTINKFRTNFKSILPKAAMLLIMFIFLFVSIGLNDLNLSINDYLYNKLGINMFIYGDINDDQGHTSSLEELNNVKNILYETKDYLESNDLAKVYLEEFLYTDYVYSAINVDDENNYKFIFFPDEYGNLPNISYNFEANRQYETLIDNYYIDSRMDDFFLINPCGYVPKIIGVNNSRPSDLVMKSLKLTNGRLISEDEISNGKYVCLVPYTTNIIDKNGIRQVEIGDTLPLTVEINGIKETYEFEIIGTTSGNYGNINIQNTAYYEDSNDVYFETDYYKNMIYIPNKCLHIISDSLNQILNDNGLYIKKIGDLKFSDYYEGVINEYTSIYSEYDKLSDFTSDGNVYYGQYIGVRPVIISINNIENVGLISDYLETSINKLNETSNRIIEYSYYSNFDNYISVISGLSTNSKLFSFLSLFFTILFMFVLVLFIINDVETNKKEIAIRTCLGQRKIFIFKDIFLEYILVSIIPFALAILLTQYITKTYVAYINSSFFETTTSMLILNNYIKKISVIPLENQTIIKILIMWISSLFISLLITFIKIKNMNSKSILMEGDLWLFLST